MYRTAAVIALSLLSACSRGPTFVTDHGVEYGRTAGHTVVLLFGGEIHDTLGGIGMVAVGPALQKAGYSVVSLDLPCYGSDAPWRHRGDTLGCWRRRIESGHRGIFRDFCARVSDVLDQLGESSVSAVGISKGGYIALVCAAQEPRITKLALICPVTDLWRLTEFQGMPRDAAFAAPLVSKPTLIRIGKWDDRVGTAEATAFAQRDNATLQLLDVHGHTAPEDGSTITWLESHK